MTIASSTESTSPSTVADLVRSNSAAVRVLQRHGIDFCCGGKRPLSDACDLAGISTADLLDEVARAGTTVTLDWSMLPLGALCDTIESRFHAPLTEEFARLQAMAARVLMVHGNKDPERLQELVDTLGTLVHALAPHLVQEETELFTAIRAGKLQNAAAQIADMEQEHEAVGGLLKQLRQLTDGYEPPVGACGTWRALYQGLGELETETHEHIHVENNVLFPAVVARA